MRPGFAPIGTKAGIPAIRITCGIRPPIHPQNQPSKTMFYTDYQCFECGAFCVGSFNSHGLQCPRCSPTCRDYKPPEPFPGDGRGFPDVDNPELAMALCFGSLTEHAHEF